MELAPGTVVEYRYTVIEPVKRGGMGAVYKVVDLRLAGAVCALKQMHELADLGTHSAVIVRRFEEEMRVLSSLRHPGIARVLDFFKHEDCLCIVMDFVEGENLEQLRDQTTVPASFVLDVAEQVLDILLYLHGNTPPVLHRDIKPANLILHPGTQRIMLVDFGLARTVSPGPTSQTMAGTLGYSSVEQLQGRAEPRSDLYSLGATMYHLVAGVLPPVFNLPRLAQTVPDVDPALANVVDRAVQMQVGDRFPDAASMLAAIREARQWIGLPALEQESELNEPAPPTLSSGAERILVVDDDPMVRMFVRRVLEREMYEVIVAEDGKMALEMALRVRPDLIVSDVEMPGLDGLALCRKLQSHRLTKDIPVLLLTGRTEVQDETRGLEAGAEDYITKPIVPERLVARVQAVLRRRLSRNL